MSNKYIPDNWQIIRVTSTDTLVEYYRIIAGWSGGYTYGSSWKVSSGCEQVFDMGDYWQVQQSSGSVYMLHKNNERPSIATAGVLESLVQSNINTVLEIVEMESILGEFGIYL